MATTYPSSSAIVPATESQVVHSCHVTLRWLYGLVPLAAGADKFFNRLANWEGYLNPAAIRVTHLSDVAFMHVVGVVEIIAGILTFARPRVGGFVVMAWLFAIALQLIAMGQFLDVAVRDVGLAIGALVLAKLSPFVDDRERSIHP